jgi:hypothetical protein
VAPALPPFLCVLHGVPWRRVAIALLVVLLIGVRGVAAETSHSPDNVADAQPRRPTILVPMYVTFAALQAFDAHSTFAATSSGGYEANPLMRDAAGSPAAMLAIKAGTAAAVVAMSERLWPHHRTAAIITMISLNSAYAMIAAHNYQTAGRLMKLTN